MKGVGCTSNEPPSGFTLSLFAASTPKKDTVGLRSQLSMFTDSFTFGIHKHVQIDIENFGTFQ